MQEQMVKSKTDCLMWSRKRVSMLTSRHHKLHVKLLLVVLTTVKMLAQSQ